MPHLNDQLIKPERAEAKSSFESSLKVRSEAAFISLASVILDLPDISQVKLVAQLRLQPAQLVSEGTARLVSPRRLGLVVSQPGATETNTHVSRVFRH